jgi:hypothetical protein
MLKIATITITFLFICGLTFVAIPSALSFEDYITSEPTIQEEGEVVETEEAPVIGGGGMYYEEATDEVETIEGQEITEQDELQENEELKYEEELEK